MTKKEGLEILSDKARKLWDESKWFKDRGNERLSELSSIQHCVVSNVMDAMRECPPWGLRGALDMYEYDLYNKMKYYQSEGINELAVMFGAAIDGLFEVKYLLKEYIK